MTGDRPYRARGRTRSRGHLAPGVVKVRVTGQPEDAKAVLALLADHDGDQVEVIGQSSAQASRYEPGVRLYLTVRIPPKEATPDA